MAKLPKSLIKKYGISKKAWSIFKKGKGIKSKSKTVTKKTTTKTRGVKIMAKRRSFKKTVKRAHKKAKLGLMYDIISGGVYGASRAKVNTMLLPLTSKLPFQMGDYADNAVMGVLSWALAKGKIPMINKFPIARKIGKAGLIVESAMAGSDLMNNYSRGTTATSSSKLLPV